jgi:hypothetical protein
MGVTGLDLSNLLSAFAGAIIGGLFTLWGARIQIKAQAAHKRVEDIEAERRLLTIVFEELSVNWAMYQKNIANRIEAVLPKSGLHYFFPLISDFFPVYRQNAGKLGSISDEAIRGGIVSVFASASGMLDSLRYNNHILQILSDLEIATQRQTGTRLSPDAPERRQVEDYGSVLREMHDDLVLRVNGVFADFKRLGIPLKSNLEKPKPQGFIACLRSEIRFLAPYVEKQAAAFIGSTLIALFFIAIDAMSSSVSNKSIPALKLVGENSVPITVAVMCMVVITLYAVLIILQNLQCANFKLSQCTLVVADFCHQFFAGALWLTVWLKCYEGQNLSIIPDAIAIFFYLTAMRWMSETKNKSGKWLFILLYAYLAFYFAIALIAFLRGIPLPKNYPMF